MKKVGSEKVYEATVPTTMYEVLLKSGDIVDPFYGENDRVLTTLSDSDYMFFREFEIDRDILNTDDVLLEFQGLDTLATVKLNGYTILHAQNMHRTYNVSVVKYLVEGINKLEIEFKSPTQYIKKKQAKDPLWGIDTTMDGYEYLRKAHHMFGWDWGPQLPDMGIWRSVNLLVVNNGKIDDFYIKQDHFDNAVDLNIEVSASGVLNNSKLKVEITDQEENCVFSGYLNVLEGVVEGQNFIVDKIDENSKIFVGEVKIENPQLWWPNGYGETYLYGLNIEIVDENENVLDKITKSIGLRTMTITRESDKWGESFDFTINGKRIFAMGANYIPEDALISRSEFYKTEDLIKDCVRANYNCIRVWGGGVYPNDEFYELCDRYGLIVWEDFMFACGVYRLTENFKANIKAEFIDNIKRIRHHASLGLWCGNNEMEWAFVEWGLPKDERLKRDYIEMYEKLIPDVLAKYDPETFYWPASPSSGGGFDKPNDDNKGDVHYWSVFHGNEHYKKFRDHYFRFASEYGMQSFPDIKTVLSYTPEEQQNIFSPVMENHNKCIAPLNGNIKILLNVAGEFQLPKELEDIVYISQVFQAETIKCAVEHFRQNRGRCMGSTYWQVNDNYPVASWSSIDVYGRWKALHYFAARFYKPLLLSSIEKGNEAFIYLTNDRLESYSGKVKYQIRHITYGIVEEDEVDVDIEPLSVSKITETSIEKYLKGYGDNRNYYLSYQLVSDDNMVVDSGTMLFTYHKHFNFPEVSIETTIEEQNSCILIKVKSDNYAKSVGIGFKDIDLVLSDNYFDIIPGEERVIIIEEFRSGSKSVEEVRKAVDIKTVNNLSY